MKNKFIKKIFIIISIIGLSLIFNFNNLKTLFENITLQKEINTLNNNIEELETKLKEVQEAETAAYNNSLSVDDWEEHLKELETNELNLQAEIETYNNEIDTLKTNIQAIKDTLK